MSTGNLRKAALATATFLALTGSAVGQNAVSTTVKAASGQTVRLGVYPSLKPDCSPGPLPEVKVVQPPKNGVFLVRQGKIKTTREGRCAVGTEVPVQLAVYQSRKDYVGPDSVTYEVKRGAETTSFVIALEVSKVDVPKPAPKAMEL